MKLKNKFLSTFGLLSVVIFFAISMSTYSFAESSETRINEDMVLQKTVVAMNVPENNVLPWGTVRGTINEPAHGYPVIIQFFEKDGNDPIHIAQVGIKNDNTYEYKFRVRDVHLETGEATNIFQGDYTVKIFKVIKSPLKDLDLI